MTHVKQAGEVRDIPLDKISHYGMQNYPTPVEDQLGVLARNSAYKDAQVQHNLTVGERKGLHG